MKNLRNILEGLLAGMDNTLDRGNVDVNAALSNIIVKGITSNDANEQKTACKAFKDLLKDGNFPTCDIVADFTSSARNSYPWYIQFKKDNRNNWYDFILIKKIGSYFYIVYIDVFGCKTKYDRQSTVKGAFNYVSFRDSIIYKVEDSVESIDNICDQILRIMYAR